MCLILLLGTPVLAQTAGQPLFERVWGLVEEHFYDPELRGVDRQQLRSDAKRLFEGVEDPERSVSLINSLLKRLDTSHTRLYSNQEPEYYQLLDVFASGPQGSEIRSLFGGKPPHYVGILATIKDGVVSDIVAGGPAHNAGLVAGDRVRLAGGQACHPIRSFSVAGQAVSLEVRRGDQTLAVEVVPRTIQPRQDFLNSIDESVEVKTEGPFQLGYVRVYSYAGEFYQDRLKEVLKTQLSEVDGLLLDIRGGWGGAQPAFLDLFQPHPIIEMTTREGESFSTEGKWNKPVALLIDDNTRSGKEIIAHGFSTQKLGPLVGRTGTAGAVSAGRLFLLPGDMALYLAVAEVRVDGEILEGVGVRPDMVVPPDHEVKSMGWSALELEILKRELHRRGNQDQAARLNSSRVEQTWSIDRDNTKWLKSVVEHYGWPKQSVVGKEAARYAWLIAQHTQDFDFQAGVLELFAEAVAQGEASQVNFAYLTDRTRMNQGRPQIWGTQLHTVEGRYEFWEIEDPETVDQRRKDLGLEPLSEYRKRFP